MAVSQEENWYPTILRVICLYIPHQYCFVDFRILINIEWFSLLGLTLLTSHNKIYAFHELFVGIWLTSCLVRMLTSSYLEKNFIRRHPLVKVRSVLFCLTLICLVFMLYFYFRHNNFCEPNIYSYFCIFEYAVVVGIMIYTGFTPNALFEYPILFFKDLMNNNKRRFLFVKDV